MHISLVSLALGVKIYIFPLVIKSIIIDHYVNVHSVSEDTRGTSHDHNSQSVSGGLKEGTMRECEGRSWEIVFSDDSNSMPASS